MIIGIQGYAIENKLFTSLYPLDNKINKKLFKELASKVFIKINLSELLSENHELRKITSYYDTLNAYNNYKKNHNSTSVNNNATILSILDNINPPELSNNSNLSFDSHVAEANAHIKEKNNLQSTEVFISEINSQKNSGFLRKCDNDDFEAFDFGSSCILGSKLNFLKRKSNTICLVDSFIFNRKKNIFINNLLAYLLGINISTQNFNNENPSSNENNHSNNIFLTSSILDKLHFFSIEETQNWRLGLENYIPELLNTEKFLVEKIQTCKCNIEKDLECDERQDQSTNQFLLNNDKNIYPNDQSKSYSSNSGNTIYDNCNNFISQFLKPSAANKQKVNINLESIGNFEIFISAANSCQLEEKQKKILSINSRQILNRNNFRIKSENFIRLEDLFIQSKNYDSNGNATQYDENLPGSEDEFFFF